MMTDQKCRIYFQDECPRIGSGWRLVTIKRGYKWAYITDYSTGKKQRVSLRLLDELNPQTTERLNG